MRKLTETEITEICQRYLTGESSLQLGREFKVSADTITRYLRSAGLVVRTSREVSQTLRRKLSDAQLAEIGRRYLDGESLSTLAKEFQTSHHTIRRYLLDQIKQSDHRRKLSSDEIAEILQRYQANENSTILGKIYNVTPANIRRILKKAGINRENLSPDRR